MTQYTYHFIGIGGIGMSALATILAQRGAQVTGSDLKDSSTVRALQNEGAQVMLGHSENNLPPLPARVTYSTAVSKDNPEYRRALKQNYPLFHRSELLAHLMLASRPLLVTGTHGKTTTSSLLAHLLVYAGLDPSYAVGGVVSSLKSNGKHGGGEYFVAEADESDGSFLNLTPFGAIVTNVGQDHMEYWKSEENIVKGFREFIEKVESKDHLFWCAEDENLVGINPKGSSYGFTSKADLHIKNYSQLGWNLSFDVTFEGKKYEEIKIPLIGDHNVLNAAAVFGLGLRLKISEEVIREAFLSFKGIGRRVERKGGYQGAFIFDDYAHHPTEIFVTLKAIKTALTRGRLIVAFQPHRYTRTKECLDQFSAAFQHADRVVLTEIYSAGEEPHEGVSNEKLFQTMRENCSVPVDFVTRNKLPSFFADFLIQEDVLITMGAGDITHVGPEILTLSGGL